MGWRSAHQLPKPEELPVYLSAAALVLGQASSRFPHRVYDMNVQTYAQIRHSATQHGRFFAPRRGHHQARAGQDSMAVSFDDPVVDPTAGAEVIPVDDQILHHTGSFSN